MDFDETYANDQFVVTDALNGSAGSNPAVTTTPNNAHKFAIPMTQANDRRVLVSDTDTTLALQQQLLAELNAGYSNNHFMLFENDGKHPHAMAVVIVHSAEGIKPLEQSVDSLRGFDIVLTTPDTLCGQIRAYNTAAAIIAEGSAAPVPRTGFGLVGVAPSKDLTRKGPSSNSKKFGYTQQLEPVTPWQMVVVDEAHVVRPKDSAVARKLSVLKGERKLALTKTPISNTPQDVFNILCFIGDKTPKDFDAFKYFVTGMSW